MLGMLAGSFMLSSVLTGCGSSKDSGSASSTASSSTTSASSQSGSTPAAQNSPLTIDVFDNAANYQGEQTGWFGKVVKDKFNLTLNMLSPQVAGDTLYKTRAAAGNLGDLMIIDNNQLEECIPAGLVTDLTGNIKNYPNLMNYSKHFEYFNSSFNKKVNPDGLIYGMPTNEADTSPTAYSQSIPYSSPIMPWDYYSEVGAPQMNNLNDLLGTLKKMKDAHPKTADGKPINAITLWKDWDGNLMENVRWLCNWYGYQTPNETSSVLLNAAGNVVPFSDDNGMYHKILKFYFDANQMGLVDPDSASQDWNAVADKLTNKQVLLLWYSWQTGFYNSIERGKKKDGNVFVPISDLHILQEGDAYYGDGRVFAIGSKAKDPDRIMQFLDWYVSPEGMRYQCSGIEGFTYEKTADGKFKYTDKGQTAFTDNLPVPAEFGGGGYKDGQSKINIFLMSDFTKDTQTDEFYNPNYWSSTIEANKTALNNDWSAKYKAKDAVDYLQQHKMLDIVPSINTTYGADSSDIKNKRSQCKELVKNTSWKMIFAKNQNEFDQLWGKMKTDLVGLGWDDLIKVDTEKCKTLVDLRAQAIANAK